MSVLLEVGGVKLGKEPHPSVGDKEGQIAFGQAGVGTFKIRRGKKPSVFPTGIQLIVRRSQVIIKEPGMPDAVFEAPLVNRLAPCGVYNLEGKPRHFKATNTTQQAMIGREVRYFTAQTMSEIVTEHRWTWTGGGSSPEDETCTNGNPVDDWSANSRWYVESSSSHLNDTGGAITVTGMDLLNASDVIYASLTGLTINVPDGDTCDFTWTHSVYKAAASAGDGAGALCRSILTWLFSNNENTVPVAFVEVWGGGAKKLGPYSVSYDPATGKADYSSTYTKWYKDNVTNSGANFNYDTLRVKDSDSNVIADISVTPGTWNSGDTKDIEFTCTWSDKP